MPKIKLIDRTIAVNGDITKNPDAKIVPLGRLMPGDVFVFAKDSDRPYMVVSFPADDSFGIVDLSGSEVRSFMSSRYMNVVRIDTEIVYRLPKAPIML